MNSFLYRHPWKWYSWWRSQVSSNRGHESM